MLRLFIIQVVSVKQTQQTLTLLMFTVRLCCATILPLVKNETLGRINEPRGIVNDSMADNYQSWGRVPIAHNQQVEKIEWRHNLPKLNDFETSVLPYGYGRSYGDSCTNEGGTLLDITGLNHLIAFDRENGTICCEAGMMLKDILELIVPEGWFIPVSPGTKYVSVGGAIANDVHGKNHHIEGTFGRHVTQFELLRSDGERLVCSPTQNIELYEATIGGLGLTGIIVWAEFTLKRIPSGFIESESIQFGSIDEFFQLSEQYKYQPYSVSWIDCTATGEHFGRGLFGYGDFYDPPLGKNGNMNEPPKLTVPFDFPSFAVNPITVKMFNELYYRKQIVPRKHSISHYDPFFYPLDAIRNWYRGYGKRGFFQYQFVMDYKEGYEALVEVLKRIVTSGQASPLVVFKTFGAIESPGMLSFPREGVTLALDFPNRGKKTLRLLDDLDSIVIPNGGRLYPAKDARMSGDAFRKSYPNWEDFAQYIDPKFSSGFWRRVTADVGETHA